MISYKSFKDNFSEADIKALHVYYHSYTYQSYINPEKKANEQNTTMTLIVSQKPVKFLKKNKKLISEPVKGHYMVYHGSYYAHIINLEEIEFDGVDGVLLSEFVRDPGKISQMRKSKGYQGIKKSLTFW